MVKPESGRGEGKWTIVLDSRPGFATPDLALTIERVARHFAPAEDASYGIDDSGVLTLSFDVEADTFGDAVSAAVRRVEQLFEAEGVLFPIDPQLIPSPEDRESLGD